jgi:hypothetical protein
MIKSYFVLLFILTLGQSLKLFGQVEQVWAIIGKSLTLNCNSENAGGCRWRNPSGELISGEFCILTIEAISQSDMGQWYCMASSNDKVDKVFDVTLALEPADVRLEAVAERSEVRCVVTKARPRPEFRWYLDNVIIENTMTKDFEGIK